jgi:hypothetical protein
MPICASSSSQEGRPTLIEIPAPANRITRLSATAVASALNVLPSSIFFVNTAAPEQRFGDGPAGSCVLRINRYRRPLREPEKGFGLVMIVLL